VTPNILLSSRVATFDLAGRCRMEKLVAHPVVSRFLQQEEHLELLAACITTRSLESQQALESAFRRFLFCLRFSKYLRSLILYAQIDYYRRERKLKSRQLLIFDAPLEEEGDLSWGEWRAWHDRPTEREQPQHEPEIFQQELEHHALHQAFAQLTPRQKLVITLAYSLGARDTEIAAELKITQQAVTKTRLAALRKLRHNLLAAQDSAERGYGRHEPTSID